MNGKTAKKLRKLFPENETTRKYEVETAVKYALINDKEVEVLKTTIVNTGNRRLYLEAKRNNGKGK
jgi:hypothetical protein